jgi:hypothetical protein
MPGRRRAHNDVEILESIPSVIGLKAFRSSLDFQSNE